MAQDIYRIDTDSPAGPDLLFWTLVGHEALSQPSAYELCVLSKEKAIAPKDILGRAFDVVIAFEDADGAGHERHCAGHAVRFVRLGRVGRYYQYRISLRSWFWLLHKRFNSRIHQKKTALQVFEATLDDSPISRIKSVGSDGVVGQLRERPYCVQHQESDYRFLSRLLEEEGIYYWFDAHAAPGKMLLSDASDLAHDMLPVAEVLNERDDAATETRDNEFSRWIDAAQYSPGRYASQDSDFKAIRKKLAGSSVDEATHELNDLEVFEFPGLHLREDDADGLARLHMEELAARRRLYWCVTTWPDVAVGRRTKLHTLQGDTDLDDEHLIVSCLFVATHMGHEGADTSAPPDLQESLLELLREDRLNAPHVEELAATLRETRALRTPAWGTHVFLMTSMPVSVPFRPPRTTPRARMPGPQSAIVVGPQGQEIHADDFGRVKVHFHWDRYDQSNEKSTCWVRVSQPWAGKGWGGYFIPRIGQEVIVDFLNGDPDRPVIMGRVYNDDQPIPFDKHEQSGFRTRSTPGGNASNCNEFRFDDSKGKEQVYLHAEKNQDIEVENDETHWVGHDRTKTIDHDETVHVKHDRTETVDNNETITIGVDRSEQVGNNETIAIGVNRTETVGSNETITIGANRSITVGASETATVALQRTHTVGINETITVGAAQEVTIGALQTVAVGASQTVSVGANRSISAGSNLSTSVGGDESRSVGKGRSAKVANDDALQVGKNFKLQAGDSISLVTGSASLTMKKDGTIVIKGKDITIQGSGKINVKASSDVIVKGSKILQN